MGISFPRRATARLGAVVLAAGALVGGTAAAAANADSYSIGGYTVDLDTQAHWITANHDGLNVAIAGGSTSAGTRAIQWYNDGGSEQKFYFDQVYDTSNGFEGYMLRNEKSQECLSTDGVAGDVVFQQPCDPRATTEFFWIVDEGGSNEFDNRYTGLYLDISGYSYGAGANIDLWYNNGQANQSFWSTAVSS